MTDINIEREAPNWPAFAPRWAQRATVHSMVEVTFETTWTIPSQFRGTADLTVIRVEQEWSAGEHGELTPDHAPRVLTGTADLWADSRAREVAATLRGIAEALDPQETSK